MLGRFFDKILFEDEDQAEGEGKKQEKPINPFPSKLTVVGIFLLALIPRLIVLFLITDPQNSGPGWYGDVYHHWQIAYLSKEIGFKQNFLRLWDFKGLEYYWGLLHPLILMAGFALSGSVSILIPRLTSVLFGSLTITLLYLVMLRYFVKEAALAASLFFALMPVVLFSDTVGMQEPLGLFLLLLGIYYWPRKAFLSGFSWMLAGMVRSEYWLFGAFLLFSVLTRSKNSHRRAIVLIGYFVPMILYMKYLLDYTGNPIYPFWTAYLATYLGDWFLEADLTQTQQLIALAAKGVSFLAVILGVITFIKRPRYYLLYLLGFANVALVAVMHGFGAYVRGYEHKVLVDRLLAFPYGFLGILASVFLLHFLPTKLGKVGTVIGASIFTVSLLATQLTWIPISNYYNQAKTPFEGEKEFARAIKNSYTGKGKILLPPGRAALTYSLVYYEGLPGEILVSEMYDSFYYYEGDDPFAEWNLFREEVVDWLSKTNAELFVVTGDFGLSENLDNYQKMIKLEEGKLFNLVEEGQGYKIYSVNINDV